MQWRQTTAAWRSVGPARRAVVEFARRFGFTDQELQDVEIAVGEAITYVTERAAARGGYLEISYRGIGRSFEVEVQDSGFRFQKDPSDEAALSDLARGLSVQLMYRVMDYVDVTHNGMRVHLVKKRASSAAGTLESDVATPAKSHDP